MAIMLYTKKVLIISLIILLASCKSEPEVYLSNVMDIMKDNSINTKNIDWKSLKSSTLKKAEGKETIEEIYPIIDELIVELNDNHSFFIRKQPKISESNFTLYCYKNIFFLFDQTSYY